ncbi:hypothetical protein [Micromonospora rubida]|uniref:hypothetical protein n=1 Tax=Micromonospora rubida TaxID=2697657 RepID=UPI00191BD40C|nr:hypothetical protein [Micromonospora rubida]
MTAERRGRIVVVSADVSAGHDTAAAESTRRLADQGLVVDRANFLGLLPRPVRWICRGAYRGGLRWTPWGYGVLIAATGWSRLVAAVLRGALTPLRGRARRAGLVAEVAARLPAVAASEAYHRRSVLDAVGEAVAVLATVLPSIRWTGRR